MPKREKAFDYVTPNSAAAGASGLVWTTKADVNFKNMTSAGSLPAGDYVFEDGTTSRVVLSGGTVTLTNGTGLILSSGATFACIGFSLLQWMTLSVLDSWRVVFKMASHTVVGSDLIGVFILDNAETPTIGYNWSDYGNSGGNIQIRVRDDASYAVVAGPVVGKNVADDPLFTAIEVAGKGFGLAHYADSPDWSSIPAADSLTVRGIGGVNCAAGTGTVALPTGWPVVRPTIVNGGVTRGTMTIERMVVQKAS